MFIGRKELLTAINDFLDSSVVLPPGDWDSKNLLSMDEINELRNRKRGRKSKDMSTSSVSERYGNTGCGVLNWGGTKLERFLHKNHTAGWN